MYLLSYLCRKETYIVYLPVQLNVVQSTAAWTSLDICLGEEEGFDQSSLPLLWL